MCIFMSLITCMPVSAAAQEWTYCLKVQISDAKDSKSKDGNIKGYLYFNGEDEEVFTLQNTKTSGEMSETTHTSSRAPWTLDKVTIENVTTDAFKILYVSLGVTYKGTNIGTITNMNGEFSLVKKDDKKRLTAEYIGYDPVEIRVDTSRTMLIAMNENKQTLNEVVVVGYGAKKNKKSTTLGSVVKVEEQAEKEITPQPVIGKRSYQKYLKENLVRPADEKCAQVKGKVVLTFLVNKEGRPFYIKVKESLCESADKEAIRLIQEGPDWIYGNKLAEVTVKFE